MLSILYRIAWKVVTMKSINPTTGELLKEYAPHTPQEIAKRIDNAHACFGEWKNVSLASRAKLMMNAAAILRERRAELSQLMAVEMGKLLKEGDGEIEKCASVCEYYAENAETYLADVPIKTAAQKSFVTYQPIGIVLAVMPWNFPFWQVFRFAVPNLMAGNVGILKHASNVSGCALAIEEIFRDAGFPEGCFSTLLVPGDQTATLIENPHIRAVTLTGSAAAGRAVAAQAGALLKKTLLELGGSDPYVVLADADIKTAAVICAKSRLLNAGQSCIAAKRFIVVKDVMAEFQEHFIAYFKTIRVGDPCDATTGIGPMARADLRDQLHAQVKKSIAQGASLLLGGSVPDEKGAFYPPTILADVKPGMVAFDKELFGPVAAFIEADDETHAFALANLSEFGLGSAIFTGDAHRAEELARTAIDAGQTFVNSFVASTPALPFGGTKSSGYGRELSHLGILEFMNAKTVSIA